MITVPKQIEDRLDSIAQRIGRTKECATEAIVDFIESEEDYQVAVERIRQNEPAIPLEEVKRRLGLAD